MSMGYFASEMLGAAREAVLNTVDEAVENERWNNIGSAAEAMIESNVKEEQVKRMLVKYWDLRPSEAERIFALAKKNQKK